MNTAYLDKRRITLFLTLAFGIAWTTSLVIYLTGGLVNSPVVIPQVGVTLATLLLAGPVMWAPALAHLLTRLITREGWQNVRLRPRIRRNWLQWLAAWFMPAILTIVGLIVFFALFPRYYDPSLATLRQMLETSAPTGINLEEINLWGLAIMQVIQGIMIAPIINGLATFGEEFGWRGYLQPKLMPLGGRRAMLVLGVIWGVWHWPAILMGHNYGLTYPGAPFLGPLAMVWFCITVGIFFGRLTLKSDSIWPAVIGHAALNGIANLGVIFVQGQPNPLLGPLPVGIIGGVGFTLLALVIFLSAHGLEEKQADIAE